MQVNTISNNSNPKVSFGKAVLVEMPYCGCNFDSGYKAMNFAINKVKVIEKSGTEPFRMTTDRFQYLLANGEQKEKIYEKLEKVYEAKSWFKKIVAKFKYGEILKSIARDKETLKIKYES